MRRGEVYEYVQVIERLGSLLHTATPGEIDDLDALLRAAIDL